MNVSQCVIMPVFTKFRKGTVSFAVYLVFDKKVFIFI